MGRAFSPPPELYRGVAPFLGRWPRLGWAAPLALKTSRNRHDLISFFNAEGANDTSLGERPRRSNPTTKTGRGLKARPMLVQPNVSHSISMVKRP